MKIGFYAPNLLFHKKNRFMKKLKAFAGLLYD